MVGGFKRVEKDFSLFSSKKRNQNKKCLKPSTSHVFTSHYSEPIFVEHPAWGCDDLLTHVAQDPVVPQKKSTAGLARGAPRGIPMEKSDRSRIDPCLKHSNIDGSWEN